MDHAQGSTYATFLAYVSLTTRAEKGLLLQSITLPQGNDGSDFVDTVELGITTSDVRVLRITLDL